MTASDVSLLLPERTNTILYCRRWAQTVRFYRAQMQFPVAFENDWFVEFQINETTFLSVADAARATIEAVDGQGVTLAWRVADLHAARAFCLAAGVQTTAVQRRWGAHVFYCHDPEGHRIEFWSPMEE